MAGFLHVLFHGLFCFFDDGNHIIVRVPRVRHKDHDADGGKDATQAKPIITEHAYLAGNWLGERTFPPGRYELEGVDAGSHGFNKDHNMALKGAKLAEKPGHHVYATMTFPRPLHIKSLQRAKIDPKTFLDGDDKDMAAEVKEIATLQVFTYRFTNHKKLKLSPLPAEYFTAEENMAGGFCSLHLFAEPDTKPKDARSHASNAMEAALKMYSKSKGEAIDLKYVKLPDVKPVRQEDAPLGTLLPELEDLSRRIERLSRLGAARRRFDNLNETFERRGRDFKPKRLEGTESEEDPLNCHSFTATF
jgi:hypothetical protein